MENVLNATGVVMAAAVAAALGVAAGRWGGRKWLMGFALPAAAVLLFLMTRLQPGLVFVPPFSWVVAGRSEFVAIAICAAMVAGTIFTRIPWKAARRALVAVAAGTVVVYGAGPFVFGSLMGGYYKQIPTEIDADGVCLQSTGFSCGPASAVTTLRRLGFSTTEGEICRAAETCPLTGTAPEQLAEGIRRLPGATGIEVRYRYFASIDKLAGAEGELIAEVYYLPFVDHYVAVLEITDTEVIVGDPLHGRRVLSRDHFNWIWRNSAVVIQRVR